MPRRAPKHLEGLSGAELRRFEEPPKRRIAVAPSPVPDLRPYWTPPDETRKRREDDRGLPPGNTICVRCGAWVLWSLEWPIHEKAKNRDGTDHRESCNREGDKVITIAPGPRNARTDPESGLRFYRWQGRDLPSVTSIRRMAGLPHGLHQWAINQVISYALDNLPALVHRLEDPAELAVIRHELRGAATAERDAAAKLGTAVHDAAAEGRSLAEVDPKVAPRLRQYLDWLATSGAEILGSEFQCWNLTAGYAGTADLLCRMRDGSVWLIDLKTGKGVYGEYALQVIAYSMAEFVGSDDVVDTRLTDLLHEVSGMAVLHLSDTGWEFRVLRPDADTWSAFCGLLAFSTWMTEHGTADSITTAVRSSTEGAA